MMIHECRRCEGSGHVVGHARWETPWSRWAPSPGTQTNPIGVLRRRSCPDCQGSGTLVTMEAGDVREQLRLPHRRWRRIGLAARAA